ncbi:DUF6771 family protein [Novosphingobium percolationis]|uniref:DUF6771 family protein n=1 Tax=Novosphingobium percolationis TaxID=2871811 RepID=UPI001CD7E1F3|nr:DUF6771 family protein [Novosphingobium percolationis]
MRIDTDTIAQAILSAPGWARVGITAPDEHLRHDAARELACAILGTDPKPRWLDEQLKLSL